MDVGQGADDAADMRERLVRAAVELLRDEGPAALQARRVARAVGASTMAVYHHFGGMSQLHDAVVDHGFATLDARLADAPTTDDPVADLGGLALTYLAAARANPHLYDMMFRLPGHTPVEHDTDRGATPLTVSQRSYRHLVDAADRAIRSGRIGEHDPRDVAAQLWSAVHGYATLELAGHFDDRDGPATVLIPMGINIVLGLGDTTMDAARSVHRLERAVADQPTETAGTPGTPGTTGDGGRTAAS